MGERASKLSRSVLYVPASNQRAMEKAQTLGCDAVILDLEDAVAPGAKESARQAACAAVIEGGYGRRQVAIRVNSFGTPWHPADLVAACAAGPDAIVIPKVEAGSQVDEVGAFVEEHAPAHTALWLMLETPKGILYADQIAAASPRVSMLVMGTNDLLAELRASAGSDRRALHTSLSRAVLVARAAGLSIVDGVFNDLQDLEGLRLECAQGREWGFDGKTLIHPGQIGAANEAFGPSAAEVANAHALIDSWQAAQAAGESGVAVHGGRLIEELHVREAQRVLALHTAIN